MNGNYIPKWQTVADDIIAVLIGNPTRWIETITLHVDSRDMPPGIHQSIYKAAIALASDKTDSGALMDNAVAIEAGQGVTVEMVAEKMALYDSMRESNFKTQLETVKKFGAVHRTIEALKRGTVTMTAAANNGLNYEAPMQNVMKEIQAEQMTNTYHVVDLAGLLDENQAEMNGEPHPCADTGLWLLDKWVTSLRPNAFIAQVAPYKMRKTSLMANVVIHRLRQGDQVNVFSLDESRADFIYRLMAILVAEYMWKIGKYDHTLNNINGETLALAGNKWKRWDKLLQTAIQYAWDTLADVKTQCRIYDMATCRPNPESVTALCRADAMRHGGLGTIFVDHLQSFTGKKIFDKTEDGAADLHALRGELNCRMWLLAQQNEAGIKAEISEHSPNVKGGGGLAAKADTVLISKYNQGATEGYPRIVQIRLNNARNHEGSRAGYMEMHPASGWVTPRGKDEQDLNMTQFLQQLKAIGTLDLGEYSPAYADNGGTTE